MGSINDPDFVSFLLRAKRSTYAAGDAGQVAASRPQSHDLAFGDGRYSYLDTYLGGYSFVGEEAVWEYGQPLWGMNYYGTMVSTGDWATSEEGTMMEIPDGFSDFLKLSLRNVSPEAPYRGPLNFERDGYTYTCQWTGDLGFFHGQETIDMAGQVIYRLYFHGGVVR